MEVGRARALSIGAVCGPAVPLDLTHRLEGDRAVVPSQAKTSPLHMPLQDAESSLQVRRTLSWIFVRNAGELADFNAPRAPRNGSHRRARDSSPLARDGSRISSVRSA